LGGVATSPPGAPGVMGAGGVVPAARAVGAPVSPAGGGALRAGSPLGGAGWSDDPGGGPA
jgi:hypothetical protein